uniref:Uncharacterized protein n=1 Tax=Quercus lobata TaxID=97700 RepID=A0A7N2R2K7_QUELO
MCHNCLLSARDLILKGSIWPIGNRQSIKISNNRWLPCSPIFKLGVDTTMKVGNLIDHQTKQWNRSLIQATFTQSTQDDILSIKLTNLACRRVPIDRLYANCGQMKGKLTGNEMEIWVIVAWSIWNTRNQFCFEAKQSQPSDILRGATTLLQDYQRLNQHLVRP